MQKKKFHLELAVYWGLAGFLAIVFGVCVTEWMLPGAVFGTLNTIFRR